MSFIKHVKALFGTKKTPSVESTAKKSKPVKKEKTASPDGSKKHREKTRTDKMKHRPQPHGEGKRRRSTAAPHPQRREHKSAGDWQPVQVPAVDGKVRFADLDLPAELLHAVEDMDFRYCTPIQAKALPVALDGRDVCGRAQTGTVKTAAFLLTVFKRLLERPLDENSRRKGHPRALVMAPTRELCVQIAQEGEAIGRHTGLRLLAVYGGMDMQAQRAALRNKPVDIVVATPGRLLDFRQRQDVDFSQVEILVIDEADRMLDMGFIPDMRRIVFSCPPKQSRQTLLFSATLTKDVMRLASQWMNDAVTVDIEPEQVAAETIDQRVYIVTEAEKFTIVCNIIKQWNPERVIIFANRRDSTERLHDNLRHQGVSSALLSGAVEQKKRMKVLEEFREGRVPVLVATDVAGRGLHIDGIDLIINFNVPEQAEDYVHRIGRTGRVGEKGTSITFADELDSYYIPAIEEYMNRPLKCIPPPEEWLAPLAQDMLPPRKRRRPPSDGRRPGPGRKPGGPKGRSRRPPRPR